MRWTTRFQAEIEVYHESYASEDSAYAEAIKKLREAMASLTQGSGVAIDVKYRSGKITGTPEPDPRD